MVFVDETQDLTPLGLGIIRRWAEHCEWIVLAGDDQQCIYEFTGATPDAFLDPPIPDSDKRILRQSYRLPRVIQQYAKEWGDQMSRFERKDYLPRDAEGSVNKIEEKWVNPEDILADVKKVYTNGESVMYLTTCAYMLEPMIAMLRANGEPFHNPYRTKRGDWNPLNTSGVSIAQRLSCFLRPSREYWSDNARMWTEREVGQWVRLLKADGIIRRGQKGKAEEMDSEREISIARVEQIFEPAAVDPVLNVDLQWFADHVIPKRKTSLGYPLQVLRKYGVRGLSDTPQICVGTIHSVKGGEANAVYIMPDLSMAGMYEWMGDAKQKDSVLRQFYVGMTRAKDDVYLGKAATNLAVKW